MTRECAMDFFKEKGFKVDESFSNVLTKKGARLIFKEDLIIASEGSISAIIEYKEIEKSLESKEDDLYVHVSYGLLFTN